MVKSEAAERRGFGVTLFERLLRTHGESVGTMLTEQYRMNACICRWASDELYGGRLVAAPAVAEHTLAGLDHVEANELTEAALLLIDTAGCDCEEDEVHSGGSGSNGGGSSGNGLARLSELVAGSKSNAAEARLVGEHVRALLAAGLRHAEIGVITPYNAQVERLREELAEERLIPSASGEGSALEVGTVDGFQGREKEAIVISLVRSNGRREVRLPCQAHQAFIWHAFPLTVPVPLRVRPCSDLVRIPGHVHQRAPRQVGFLAEDRRMNVAITRGR